MAPALTSGFGPGEVRVVTVELSVFVIVGLVTVVGFLGGKTFLAK